MQIPLHLLFLTSIAIAVIALVLAYGWYATSALSAIAVAGLVAACSLTPSTGPLSEGNAWQRTCPTGKELATFVSFDISKSSAPEPFGAAQDQYPVIHDAVARTAVCGGHLSVTAFAGSSANPVQLWDGQLTLPGATDNARYRRLEDVTETVSREVANAYNAAISKGPRSGSDIVGQLRRAVEFGEQVGPEAHLSVVLVTDGLQSVSAHRVVVRNVQDAKAYADSVPVPKLDGELLVTGIGDRIDGQEVSTITVEILKAIYARICERTGADPCRAVTDYTSPIGSGS